MIFYCAFLQRSYIQNENVSLSSYSSNDIYYSWCQIYINLRPRASCHMNHIQHTVCIRNNTIKHWFMTQHLTFKYLYIKIIVSKWSLTCTNITILMSLFFVVNILYVFPNNIVILIISLVSLCVCVNIHTFDY